MIFLLCILYNCDMFFAPATFLTAYKVLECESLKKADSSFHSPLCRNYIGTLGICYNFSSSSLLYVRLFRLFVLYLKGSSNIIGNST